MEFGARAAWEVTKDVGKIVGEDARNAGIGILPPAAASILLDKAFKVKAIRGGLNGEMRESAHNLNNRILRQKQRVYGPEKP